MGTESDDLEQAIHDHGQVTAEYVRVHEGIRAGLPVRRRRTRWLPLLVTAVLVAAGFTAVFAGRAHFVPTPTTQAPLSGWPDATNTGYIGTGTSLTAYAGSCLITTDNTVISQKLMDCRTPDNALIIHAANVQIVKSKVLGLVILDTDLSGATGWSFSLTDTEVDSGAQQQAAVCCGNMTILRSNIHGGQTAVQCESGAVGGAGDTSVTCGITDSYLHGQAPPVGAQWHLGGFLTEGGNNTISLTHNFVACDAPAYPPDGGCSGDINIIPNFGVAQNVTVTNNKLGASTDLAYCTFGGEKSTSPFPNGNNIKYHDNVFVRGTNNLCGAYGPWTDFNPSGTGNEWVNNRYDDGVLITAP